MNSRLRDCCNFEVFTPVTTKSNSALVWRDAAYQEGSVKYKYEWIQVVFFLFRICNRFPLGEKNDTQLKENFEYFLKKKNSTPGGTRTHNLWIRSPTR